MDLDPVAWSTVDTSSTSDPDIALTWSIDVAGEGNPAQFFLARERFESAVRTADSFAMTLAGDSCFGLGLGVDPHTSDQWERCVVPQSSRTRLGQLVAVDDWDFYAAPLAHTNEGTEVVVQRDPSEVNEFLLENFPESSVWPGHREVVHWYGLRDGERLTSLGALVRWESGRHVLASIATRREGRGRGFAELLVRGMMTRASDDGVEWLGLGVASSNDVAQRVYQRAGFTRRTSFRTFAQPIASDTRPVPTHS